MTTYIQHPGLVSSLKEGVMKISLSETGGCSACHKSLCVLGEAGPKLIEVPFTMGAFQVGDQVMVQIKPSTGYAAVWWLYLLPFFLMLGMMIGMLRTQQDEGLAGLAALLVLIPYYGLLFLLRRTIRKECMLTVLKKNE